MALARPIHAGVRSSLFAHAYFPMEVTSYRNLSRSLYWRSESKPRGRRGLPTGHRSRPIFRGITGSDWLLPANQLGSGETTPFGPSPGVTRLASLRSGPRATSPLSSKNRVRKVQGDRLHLPAVFGGLTAYDTQRIKDTYLAVQRGEDWG